MMAVNCVYIVILELLFVCVENTLQIPQRPSQEPLSNVIQDMAPPITLDVVKTQLRDSGVFDWQSAELNGGMRTELKNLSDSLELYISSRNRQPSTVQSTFANIELVRTVVKELLAKGKISKTFADQFKWNLTSSQIKSRNAL